MAEFVEVAQLDTIPLGTGTTVTVAGKDIALFHVDGVVYAMDDACLHHGASLGFGKLDGEVVTCRAHGWKYNVTTGKTLNVPDYGVGCYAVKVVEGKVLLSVEPTAAAK
jgi:nitrite reductase/ring-hydroxylating ferredoxin subunit